MASQQVNGMSHSNLNHGKEIAKNTERTRYNTAPQRCMERASLQLRASSPFFAVKGRVRREILKSGALLHLTPYSLRGSGSGCCRGAERSSSRLDQSCMCTRRKGKCKKTYYYYYSYKEENMTEEEEEEEEKTK